MTLRTRWTVFYVLIAVFIWELSPIIGCLRHLLQNQIRCSHLTSPFSLCGTGWPVMTMKFLRAFRVTKTSTMTRHF